MARRKADHEPRQKPGGMTSSKRGFVPRGSARGAQPEGFYHQALSEAERISLPEARKIEGLDEEIALLRVRLKSLMAEHPENIPLLFKGVELLVKAVSTKYRLSKKAEKNLYDSVLGVLRGIGGTLWPEGFST